MESQALFLGLRADGATTIIQNVDCEKEEYKKNREETILSEFKDITIQEVEKSIDMPKPVSKVIHFFMDRKKRQ